MKVHELITELMKIPAGTNVRISIGPTDYVDIDQIETLDGDIGLFASDAAWTDTNTGDYYASLEASLEDYASMPDADEDTP